MSNKTNFKVFQASAGAGKTFTLIKEYLKLCLCNEGSVANFRNILAITFTNAAANEMKEKIVKALCEIIESEKVAPKSMEAVLLTELGITDEELKRNAQKLMTCIMHDYSSFCVSTIDAFVQKLSRSFARDLGLSSQYTVSIDNDEVAEMIVENLGMKIKDENDYLTRLIIDFSNHQFDNEHYTPIETLLSDFVKKLMEEKAYQKDENNLLGGPEYRQTLDFLDAKTSAYEQTIMGFVKQFKDAASGFNIGDEQFNYGKGGFVSFINKLSKKVYDAPGARFRSAIEKKNCFSKDAEKRFGKPQLDAMNAALVPILESLLAYYQAETSAFLFYRSQRDLLYLYALRTQIRMEFEQLASVEEVVHISEFNKLLHTVMGDFTVPFVYERIGEYFRHVFVDEFQDTSVLQWQNLLPLVDNGLSAGKMSMVVGDGKQSIYRFRSGEVEQIVRLPEIFALPTDARRAAFQQYERNLKDNFSFTNLDTNYRSFAQVVDFNNAFFESAYKGLSPDLQKVYVDEKPGTDLGVRIFQKKDHNEEGLVQVELYDPKSQQDYCFGRVEAIVRELVGHCGYRFDDITVLTRRSDYGTDLANYLNDNGIPVVSQVSILLKSSNKVQLLVNTLRYLMYSENETNVANVLFYWKLINESDFDGNVSHCFDAVKSIACGATAIEEVMGIGQDGQLRMALSKATCLYDLCASLLRLYGLDTIRDAFVNYFMEEVFKWQSSKKESILDFLSFWEKKQDKLAVKSVSNNAVNIMTIHKSKGLEFPVVIYPDAITDLSERLNPGKSPEVWVSPQDLDFAPIPNLNNVLFKMNEAAKNMGDKAVEMLEREQASNRLDNLNLLYVAFTRAKQRLYVIAKQADAKKENIIRVFLDSDTIYQKPEIEDHGSSKVYRFGAADFRNPKEKKERDEETVMADSVSAEWFQKIKIDAMPTQLWRSENEHLQPREWGELVHQILSKIRLADDVEKVLRPYMADGTIDANDADWVRSNFMRMMQQPQIAAAFQSGAKVKTECELLYDGMVRRLDRYAELSDVIYLIDYKTGKKDEGHQTQVVTYTKALRELTDKEIRAFLVYLSDSGIEVVSVPTSINA